MDIKDFKNVYVFAEQRNGIIQSVAYELLGKARDLADALGEKVVALLAGYNVKDQAQSLIEMGADEVLVADCPELSYRTVLTGCVPHDFRTQAFYRSLRRYNNWT